MSRFTKHVMNKADLELRTLWELSHKQNLQYARIQYLVSDMKDLLRVGGPDKLKEKLDLWGNSGCWARVQLEQLAREVYRNKSPATVDLGKWVSVEIECFLPGEKSVTAFVAWVRAKGYSKHVTVKNDGSLHADHECQGCEDSEDTGGDNCSCDRPIGKEFVVTFKQAQAQT